MSYQEQAKVMAHNLASGSQIAKERPSMETALDRLRSTIDRADARFAEITARCERVLRDLPPATGNKGDSPCSGDSAYVRAVDSASCSVESLIDRMIDFCHRLEA